jgi:hypothetical protein
MCKVLCCSCVYRQMVFWKSKVRRLLLLRMEIYAFDSP